MTTLAAQAGGRGGEDWGGNDNPANINSNGNINNNRNVNNNTAVGIGFGLGIAKSNSSANASAKQGQVQGQAQKQTQNTRQANKQTTTITSNVEGSNYVGLDTPVCGNSAGGSNSQGAFGLTFDSRNCNIRAEAALLNNIGLTTAAKKQTCFMRRVRNNSAMKDFCVGYNK